MIAGADTPTPACIEDVWGRAWRFAQADERVSTDVKRAQRLTPSQVSPSDFLRECAWAVLGARRHYEVLEKRWPAIEKAFCHWDVRKVVKKRASVRTKALQALNSPRKVDGVLKIARWLDEKTWPVVRAEFLSRVTADHQDTPAVTDDLLKWLDRLPWIGQTLAAYIAKNLGIGSIKDDVWMCRLADRLGYSPDAAGVWKMALDIQVFSKQRINVIDTVLWNWARNQKWLAQT